MNRSPVPTRPTAALVAVLVVLASLLSAGCGPKSSTPDLVIYATGSLFGQLQTCG